MIKRKTKRHAHSKREPKYDVYSESETSLMPSKRTQRRDHNRNPYSRYREKYNTDYEYGSYEEYDVYSDRHGYTSDPYDSYYGNFTDSEDDQYNYYRSKYDYYDNYYHMPQYASYNDSESALTRNESISDCKTCNKRNKRNHQRVHNNYKQIYRMEQPSYKNQSRRRKTNRREVPIETVDTEMSSYGDEFKVYAAQISGQHGFKYKKKRVSNESTETKYQDESEYQHETDYETEDYKDGRQNMRKNRQEFLTYNTELKNNTNQGAFSAPKKRSPEKLVSITNYENVSMLGFENKNSNNLGKRVDSEIVYLPVVMVSDIKRSSHSKKSGNQFINGGPGEIAEKPLENNVAVYAAFNQKQGNIFEQAQTDTKKDYNSLAPYLKDTTVYTLSTRLSKVTGRQSKAKTSTVNKENVEKQSTASEHTNLQDRPDASTISIIPFPSKVNPNASKRSFSNARSISMVTGARYDEDKQSNASQINTQSIVRKSKVGEQQVDDMRRSNVNPSTQNAVLEERKSFIPQQYPIQGMRASEFAERILAAQREKSMMANPSEGPLSPQEDINKMKEENKDDQSIKKSTLRQQNISRSQSKVVGNEQMSMVAASGQESVMRQSTAALRGQSTAAPTSQSIVAPKGKSIATSRLQSTAIPRDQSVAAPRGQSIVAPTYQSVAQSRGQSMAVPMSQNVAQPRGQSMAAPMSQSVAQSRVQSMAAPIGQSVAQSRGQNITAPISQSIAAPTSQSTATPKEQSIVNDRGKSTAATGAQSIAVPKDQSFAVPKGQSVVVGRKSMGPEQQTFVSDKQSTLMVRQNDQVGTVRQSAVAPYTKSMAGGNKSIAAEQQRAEDGLRREQNETQYGQKSGIQQSFVGPMGQSTAVGRRSLALEEQKQNGQKSILRPNTNAPHSVLQTRTTFSQPPGHGGMTETETQNYESFIGQSTSYPQRKSHNGNKKNLISYQRKTQPDTIQRGSVSQKHVISSDTSLSQSRTSGKSKRLQKSTAKPSKSKSVLKRMFSKKKKDQTPSKYQLQPIPSSTRTMLDEIMDSTNEGQSTEESRIVTADRPTKAQQSKSKKSKISKLSKLKSMLKKKSKGKKDTDEDQFPEPEIGILDQETDEQFLQDGHIEDGYIEDEYIEDTQDENQILEVSDESQFKSSIQETFTPTISGYDLTTVVNFLQIGQFLIGVTVFEKLMEIFEAFPHNF